MTKLAAVFVVACACTHDAPTWAWAPDEATAFARARAEHAGVMVELYASWSVPCEELDRTLHGAHVGAALRGKFVPVKLDVSDGNDDLRARYRAQTLPAVVFVDTAGSVHGRIDRLIEEPEVISAIERAAAR